MEPTTLRIANMVRRDVVLREAVARGIINQRAVARWLREARGVDASEAAIASALRRIRAEGGLAPSAVSGLLAESNLSTRSHVCIVVLPKVAGVNQRLPALLAGVDYAKGESLRIIHAARYVKVILDDFNLERLHAAMGPIETTVRRGVVELNIIFPDDSREIPGVIATVCSVLAMEGINLVEVVSGAPELTLFIDQKDALRAHELLAGLTGSRPFTRRRNPQRLVQIGEDGPNRPEDADPRPRPKHVARNRRAPASGASARRRPI